MATDRRRKRRVSFDPDKQTMDPLDVWFPSPGKEGVAITSRVAPALKEQIAEIVQSGETRYRKESDLVRAAVMVFVAERIAPRMGGRFNLDVKLLHAKARAAALVQRIADVQDFHNKTIRALGDLAVAEMWDAGVDFWHDSLRTAETIGPEVLKELRRRLATTGKLNKLRARVEAVEAMGGE